MADNETLISFYDGVTVRVGGSFQRVDRGGAVPAGADPDHVKLLVDRKLVGKGKPVGGVAFDPHVPPPFVGVEETRSAGSGYDGTSAPAKSGSKADWLAWAVKVEGVAMDSPEGEALAARTRDELAATYAERQPAPAS
jgi:hypothetical protein